MDSSETKKLLEEDYDYEIINPEEVVEDNNWKYAESSSSVPASSSEHAVMGLQEKSVFVASPKDPRLGERIPLLGKSASTSSNPEDERNQRSKPSSLRQKFRKLYEKVVDKLPGKSASTSSKPSETVSLLDKRPGKSASTSSNPGAVREGERNQRNEPRPYMAPPGDFSPEAFEQMRMENDPVLTKLWETYDKMYKGSEP